MIKLVASLTTLFSLVLCLMFLLTTGPEMAISCALGAAIIIINFLGIVFLWRLIFFKKSIALAVWVIIFKYGILGLILWSLSHYQWMQPIGLAYGLMCWLVAIVTSIGLKKLFSKRGSNAF